MKVGIMQPYFFPYIGYWQLINAVDKYVIYDDVNYIKRGWINRNRILINNSIENINLSINKASQNKLINELSLFEPNKNFNKILKTIGYNYRKAKEFDSVFSVIEKIFSCKEENLAKFLEHSIRELSNYMGIETEIIVSSDIVKDNTLHGQKKIIDICEVLKGDVYINAIGGQELYDKENFLKQNIDLKFLMSNMREYKQFGNVFQPGLSIIDVLMFNSKQEIWEMLNDYKLI